MGIFLVSYIKHPATTLSNIPIAEGNLPERQPYNPGHFFELTTKGSNSLSCTWAEALEALSTQKWGELQQHLGRIVNAVLDILNRGQCKQLQEDDSFTVRPNGADNVLQLFSTPNRFNNIYWPRPTEPTLPFVEEEDAKRVSVTVPKPTTAATSQPK